VTVLFDVPSKEEDDAFDFRSKHLFLPLLAIFELWKLLLSCKSVTRNKHILPIILNSIIAIFLCRLCQQLVLLLWWYFVIVHCANSKQQNKQLYQATKQAVVAVVAVVAGCRL
jgi:hypothetical protein